jgi:pyrimidine operon attenuation protein/uracil phosphoribosyltransferase
MAENFPVLKQIMSEADLERALGALAAQLHRDFPDDPDLVLLGIRTRGVYLSQRIAGILKSKHNQDVTLGEIDITLYRDDLSTLGPQAVVGSTDIGFDVTGKNIILVDDVLFTGRTVRAALDQIVDFGRPRLIRLLVVVDRGMHEYPIQADYMGRKIDTDETHVVQVRLAEVDGDNGVSLCQLPG